MRINKSKLKNIIQEELRILLNEQQYVNVPNNLVYNPDKEKTFTGKKGFKHTLVGKGNVWRVTLPGKKAKWMTSGQFAYWFAKTTQRAGALGKLPTGVKIERKYRSGDPADYAGKPIAEVPTTMGMFQQDVTDQFKLELGPEEKEARRLAREEALQAKLDQERAERNPLFQPEEPKGASGDPEAEPEEKGVMVFPPDVHSVPKPRPRGETVDPGRPLTPTEAEEAAEMSMPWEHPLGSGMDPTQSYPPGEEEYLQEMVLKEFKKLLQS
jgi:hypothetical protein